MNNFIIITIIVCFVAWFYFTKFQESEKEYFKLHKKCSFLQNENCKLKNRLKDLQTYKNDVSKTFKILDNELLMINDQLQKQNNSLIPDSTQSFNATQENDDSNRISILSPDILQSLFLNMNQERINSEHTYDNLLNESINNIINQDIQNTINTNLDNHLQNIPIETNETTNVETNINKMDIDTNDINLNINTNIIDNNTIDGVSNIDNSMNNKKVLSNLLSGMPNNGYEEFLLN